MPLLLFCNINRSYIFRRGLDVSEIAEICWMPRRHKKGKSSFSVDPCRKDKVDDMKANKRDVRRIINLARGYDRNLCGRDFLICYGSVS